MPSKPSVGRPSPLIWTSCAIPPISNTGGGTFRRCRISWTPAIRNERRRHHPDGRATVTGAPGDGRAGVSSAEGQAFGQPCAVRTGYRAPPEMLEAMPALPLCPPPDEAWPKRLRWRRRWSRRRKIHAPRITRSTKATSALLPQVSLSLQYQYAKNSSVIGILSPSVTQREASVFVQVTVPLYQGGAEYAAVRQAKSCAASPRQYHGRGPAGPRDRPIRMGIFTSAQASIASNELAVQANQGAVMGVPSGTARRRTFDPGHSERTAGAAFRRNRPRQRTA